MIRSASVLFRFVPFALAMAGVPAGRCAERLVWETADFAAGTGTNGWTVSSDAWVSPSYPSAPQRVTLSGADLADGAALTVLRAGSNLNVTATGGARLTALTAGYFVTQLETPAAPAVTNVLDGACRVDWPSVANAVGYCVTFATNRVEGASAGDELFAESFGNVIAKGNVSALDDKFYEMLDFPQAGWSFANCYYGTTGNTGPGVVQIGSTSSPGFLALPVPAACADASGLTLRIAARRFADAAPDMPLARVTASGVTDVVAVVTLTEDAATYHLPLPELAPDDTLYFHSSTNKKDGRVILDDVRILSGYQAGQSVADVFRTVDTAETSCTVADLPLAEVTIGVTARAAEAKDDSAASPAVTVNFADPPRMPILRAVPLSACAGGGYAEDFGALSNIVKKTSWYNGVWPVPYWMGYDGRGEVVSTVYSYSPATSYSGFFAIVSTNEPTRTALGFRGRADTDFFHGIAFHNDTGMPRKDLAIAYTGVQWNWKNALPMTNAVEYLITNALVGTSVAGDWRPIAELTFTPPYTAADADAGEWWGDRQAVTLSGVTLGADAYLILRWVVPATSPGGGTGVSDFSFSSTRVPLASYLFLR